MSTSSLVQAIIDMIIAEISPGEELELFREHLLSADIDFLAILLPSVQKYREVFLKENRLLVLAPKSNVALAHANWQLTREVHEGLKIQMSQTT